MYSEKEMLQDLEKAITGNDMNRIRRKCIEAKVEWGKVSADVKKLYVATQNRIHPCAEEYKNNPDIHYDISHFSRDGKLKD